MIIKSLGVCCNLEKYGVLRHEISKEYNVNPPIYPANDLQKENTPVVHYFTRQWVVMGYNVVVIHYPYNFPKCVGRFIRPFVKYAKKLFGMAVIRTTYLSENDYILEDVRVKRIPLKKVKPHGRYKKKEIRKAYNNTVDYLRSINFVPDIVVAHWANPQLELLPLFKQKYSVPVCYVDHLAGRDILSAYKNQSYQLISCLDLIGYRSDYIKRRFEEQFHPTCRSFYCYSGIPEQYLPEETITRKIDAVRTFIFVGTFIKRKYPAGIIPALCKAYGQEPFAMKYVGRGQEEDSIRTIASECDVTEKVEILGFMPRVEVVKRLDESDVFIMMSKNETFGLVYLEAMARGCITIASRSEGFDGIIQDGVNGFLCEAGDANDLANVINKIRSLSIEELSKMSSNAMQTARCLTDKKVASDYLACLKEAVNQYC